jgi:hypothetical protein
MLVYQHTSMWRDMAQHHCALILATRSFDAHPRSARLPDAAEPRPPHADQQEPTKIIMKELLHRAITTNSTRIIVSDYSGYLLADEERIQITESQPPELEAKGVSICRAPVT